MKLTPSSTPQARLSSELINKTFGKSSVSKQIKWNEKAKKFDSFEPDPSSYISSVYDEASRTLVLFGPVEPLELAAELILEFETGEGKAGEVKNFSSHQDERRGVGLDESRGS